MLLTWGRAKNFRLGRPVVNEDARVPEVVPGFDHARVKMVSCGGGHTCVVLEGHELYVFGYSQYGQLGLGSREDTHVPTQVVVDCFEEEEEVDDEEDDEVDEENELSEESELGENQVEDEDLIGWDMVACGRYHTVALTRSGEMYSWGGGKNGRLGHGDERIRTSPSRIQGLPEPVVSVACGYHSTLAVTVSSKVFAWGWGMHGQLGLGDTDDRFVPTQLPCFPPPRRKIVIVACGDRHSFAITDLGEVFGWGSNQFGQLGNGSRGEMYLKPERITELEGLSIRCIGSGDRHSAAITSLGVVYTWGCGSDGQTGHGDFFDVLRPRRVEALRDICMLDVKCGHNFTMALAETKDVYAWGNDAYGQLGTGQPGLSQTLSLPVKVSLGSEIIVRGITCAHFHCVLWSETSESSEEMVEEFDEGDETTTFRITQSSRGQLIANRRERKALLASFDEMTQRRNGRLPPNGPYNSNL
mmetsp:Transcript_18230/g.38064  ORF Transcript_18230/g.38064 Transcript_18230/m.38064 type:complete len:471 (-) Transcript_18230:1643-3055(-)